MKKNELIEAVAEYAGISKLAADKAIYAIAAATAKTLAAGEEMPLPGIGKFQVKERAARTGRNPKTGEPVQIAASKAIKFKPAKFLKDKIA